MISLNINGKQVEVPAGTTILDAAKKLDIHIPTLCHLDMHDFKMVNQEASCRVCLVEMAGRKALLPACATPAAQGMEIRTHTPRTINARRAVLELILSNHPKTCLTCAKNSVCELQALAAELGIHEIKYTGEMAEHRRDASSPAFVKEMSKCILCRRCETMCNNVQTVKVLSGIRRGFTTTVGPAFDEPMIDTTCVFCGQCVAVCPTGALSEVNNISRLWDALADPEKYVVVQTAPAVRAALGELFGMPAGVAVTGKMVAALRLLGFDKVFDTNFAADLTIMEEAAEFKHRLEHGGKLPILTSCCPGWVKFFEHQFGDMLDVPSTCKSPQQMFGAIAKTYMAEQLNVDTDKMFVVSVMPCLAKKYEAARAELNVDMIREVDLVITTRELGKMIREAGINFLSLPDERYDDPMGESTGAAVIFGTSGGVLEAALRTAYEWITGEILEKVEFGALRGFKGIKEATVRVGDLDVKVAVASGLGNARQLLENIREGKAHYHAIEIMACPGGCIDGGGQPYHHGNIEILEKRMRALFNEDKSKRLRKSHENPFIQKLYADFLGEPHSLLAQKLLHTTYTKRRRM
ncbi:NADP-reducing hydrogenase subunit HndC [uncultured delta proteobacterium]|uniref:NADP-reducing hydrogenase subunit HndC n=1 Tax=uncultured delta proteobacterium TaxID=34034 RepID=A0A212JB46_9DELT|nr:NADP-reducing hydrogenase subunit HndC [uncultured delta proteobacterium]